jgi:aspartate/methionine/tyrosine aminotransferase
MGYATRTRHLAPEGAYQVLAKAGQLEAAGKEIVHFEIGQPDYETFSNVSLAGIRAISQGMTRYTHPAGIVPLREAIALDAGGRRGIRIHPDEVVVSPGGPNLFFPTLAGEPGNRSFAQPGIPDVRAMIGVAGGVRSRATPSAVLIRPRRIRKFKSARDHSQ